MEKIDHARKGRTVDIKENFYIYIYKHYNKLIYEQKAQVEHHANILYDISLMYIDTPM
jgi:hypothetical protein